MILKEVSTFDFSSIVGQKLSMEAMLIGDKIRGIRTLRGLSQENVADMLNMSLLAYGDIERNKIKKLSLKRLEQVGEVLGVSVLDILSFNNAISNRFTYCQNTQVVNGSHATQMTRYYLNREWEKKLEVLTKEMEILKTENERLTWEVRYWREKWQRESMN